ncbi:hypothetical protein Lser_V15G01656 [Lactuca serriola]
MVSTRRDTRSTKKVSESSSLLQRNLSLVKTEEPQLDDPTQNSSKRVGETTSAASKRSSACLDTQPTLKTEDPYTVMQTDIPAEKKTPEGSHGAVDLWRGIAVGREVKELLEAVEHCYPHTFQRVQIRVTRFWLGNLNELHVAIKRFMESSVDVLMEEEITGFHQDFKDLESLGFDLTWAHKRLNMVARLKFGNEPLHKEFMALEQSLGPLKERVDGTRKQLLEFHNMYRKASSEYEDATKARNKKAEEVAQEFGPDFDRILKDRLGFGMLPGY